MITLEGGNRTGGTDTTLDVGQVFEISGAEPSALPTETKLGTPFPERQRVDARSTQLAPATSEQGAGPFMRAYQSPIAISLLGAAAGGILFLGLPPTVSARQGATPVAQTTTDEGVIASRIKGLEQRIAGLRKVAVNSEVGDLLDRAETSLKDAKKPGNGYLLSSAESYLKAADLKNKEAKASKAAASARSKAIFYGTVSLVALIGLAITIQRMRLKGASASEIEKAKKITGELATIINEFHGLKQELQWHVEGTPEHNVLTEMMEHTEAALIYVANMSITVEDAERTHNQHDFGMILLALMGRSGSSDPGFFKQTWNWASGHKYSEAPKFLNEYGIQFDPGAGMSEMVRNSEEGGEGQALDSLARLRGGQLVPSSEGAWTFGYEDPDREIRSVTHETTYALERAIGAFTESRDEIEPELRGTIDKIIDEVRRQGYMQ